MSSTILLRTLALSNFVSAANINSRGLEEVEGYQYIEDFSKYYAKYSTCFKVKIQENNDDQVEGNSYFYNNKYHAQYNTYAAFNLCEDNTCTGGISDDSIGYVTELQNYLEINVEFVQEYCNACDQQCSNRRLEDNEDNGVVVDCDTCRDQCDLLSNGNSNGYDEANYLECQEAVDNGDDDDIQYYMAPACENGKLIIGLFYDDECTVNSKKDSGIEFKYDTFSSVQAMCTPCDGNDEVCEGLYGESVHCDGATAVENDENNFMCKKYYNNVRVMTYARRKKNLHFWGPVLTCVMILFGCGFCSQSYYIRHRNKKNDKAEPLKDNEHGDSAAQNQSTTPEIKIT